MPALPTPTPTEKKPVADPGSGDEGEVAVEDEPDEPEEPEEPEEAVEKTLYYDFVPYDANDPILRALMIKDEEEEEPINAEMISFCKKKNENIGGIPL